VKVLRALTPEELARAEARLLNPAPGSRIEAAKKFGIDMANLISQLRKSPTERARDMQEFCHFVDTVRGAARKPNCAVLLTPNVPPVA
jgi:hypothetical protein